MSVWHDRFSHLNNNYVEKTVNLVQNMVCKGPNSESVCNSCKIAKSKHKTPNRKQNEKPRAYGEVISIDIDVLPIVSVEGFKYRLDIIEHGSGWIWTFGLEKRGHAKGHIVFIIKKLRFTLQEVRVDGAQEFVSNTVRDICSDEGIDFRIGVPYEHAQNGKVERVHGIVDDGVRSVLKRAGLPKSMHMKAANYVVHVRNRAYKKTHEVTPYELRYGVKPNVDYFKIFGCLAYAHVPKEKRKKLDDRAKKCIFVGYSDEYNSYELYDLISGKFYFGKSVDFVEDVFPGFELHRELKKWLYNDESEYSETSDENEYSDKTDYDGEDDEEVPLQGEPQLPQLQSENTDDDEELDGDGEFHDVEELNQNLDEAEVNDLGPGLNDEKAEGRRRSSRLKDKVAIDYGLQLNVGERKWNYAEAKKSDDWTEFKKEISNCIESLEYLNAFKIIPKRDLPQGANLIGSRWVCHLKADAKGRYVKHKVRLTPLGFQQKYDVDFNEVFAPVAMSVSHRILHVIALKWRRKVKNCDIINAFQTTKMEKPVYLSLPEGFDMVYPWVNSEDYCLEVYNALNGLKQSGNEFHNKFEKSMRQLKFTRSRVDSCTYFKTDEKFGMIVVANHVDDVDYVGESDELERQFFKDLCRLMPSEGGDACREHLGINITNGEDVV
jgi:hypothetical protein